MELVCIGSMRAGGSGPLSMQPVGGTGPKLLKLHGSFNWKDTWPVPQEASNRARRDRLGMPLWIPPGTYSKGKGKLPIWCSLGSG